MNVLKREAEMVARGKASEAILIGGAASDEGAVGAFAFYRFISHNESVNAQVS
jgi:hypothetical protein